MESVLKNRKDRIEKVLIEKFKPSVFDLKDVSNEHAGHTGSNPSGETHYKLKIRSSSFQDLNLVEQHKKIYSELSNEWKNGLHSLEIDSGSN